MHIRDGTWENYGINKAQRKKLREQCEDPEYIYIVIMAAQLTDTLIADWIVESVTKHKTFELIEYDRKLGQIPCGRTDFYAYRRKFYKIFKNLNWYK